ncbi:MAG: hypothetical protein HOM11_11910 [Methylococcales bacterium]|nr:hypothetical protein [Methylococcales bacterium]
MATLQYVLPTFWECALLILALLATSSAAHADTYTLSLHDQVYNQGHTLKLKKMLKKRFPNLNIRNSVINKVTLIGKSKNGQGKAKLNIGEHASNAETLMGRDYNFDNPAAYTFDGIEFNNQQELQHGKWQIRTNGTVKLRKVIVDLDTVERWAWQEYDTFYSRKYGKSDDVLHIDQTVKDIKLTGFHNTAHINKAIVTFNNGKTLNLKSLAGKLMNGESKKATFRNARLIKNIKLYYQPKHKGKNAGFTLDLFTQEEMSH